MNAKLEKLKDTFSALFNQRNEINEHKQTINQEIVDEFIASHRDEIFNVAIEKEEVVEAIRDLKNGKSDGYHGVSNGNLKYAPEQVIDFLCTIYTKMINHQSMPKDFNICILKPIIKDPA